MTAWKPPTGKGILDFDKNEHVCDGVVLFEVFALLF